MTKHATLFTLRNNGVQHAQLIQLRSAQPTQDGGRGVIHSEMPLTDSEGLPPDAQGWSACEGAAKIRYLVNAIGTESDINMLAPAQFFKCLSDDTRCKLLLLVMEEEELCVCEFSHALDTSQPKISRHLAQLRSAGLLIDRRQGQWVYYSIKHHEDQWTHKLLQEFYRVKRDHITEDLARLHSMGDRPERQRECC